jgi:hypothetical protein
MRLHNHAILAALTLIIAVFSGACSSKPFLKVQYQLPSATTRVLDGQKVSLSVADVRANDVFLTENAKKSLKGFKDSFSLVVLREDGSGNLVGAYNLNSLLIEIFKQRLENSGLYVVAAQDSADPALVIQLKNLKLDLAGRKWIISMSYQARLEDSGSLLASESINGSAERLKVVGKSDAEKILSELLTDMVNKLDLVKLFQQVRQ